MSLTALETFLEPLTALFAEDGIQEISINRPGEAWVEKYGDMRREPLPAFTNKHLQALAHLVAQSTRAGDLGGEAAALGDAAGRLPHPDRLPARLRRQQRRDVHPQADGARLQPRRIREARRLREDAHGHGRLRPGGGSAQGILRARRHQGLPRPRGEVEEEHHHLRRHKHGEDDLPQCRAQGNSADGAHFDRRGRARGQYRAHPQPRAPAGEQGRRRAAPR